MIISGDRQNHLAHLVTDGVWNDDIVDFHDDDQALRAAKIAIGEFVKEDEDIDKDARAKVASLKRNVMEGTPEWDVMYRKYYEEERAKRGQK
jgi:hypothetical protein